LRDDIIGLTHSAHRTLRAEFPGERAMLFVLELRISTRVLFHGGEPRLWIP
jgi:hypothetical protein